MVAAAGATVGASYTWLDATDGHGARLQPVDCALPHLAGTTLAAAGRFRLMLTSPGIFPDGWRLPGTDPDAVAPALSFLHHHVLAPPALRPRAVADRYVRIDRLPADAIDSRAALRLLPPLLKAYLRMGGMIGDGAVIDRQFNTIDVCLVLPTAKVRANYLRHYRQQRVPAAAA